MKNIISVLFVAILFAGCATLPALNFSVSDVKPSTQKIDAELKSITVSLANPKEQKGKFSVGMENITSIWKEALEDSLNRMAIFKDGATTKYHLSVKILDIDIPLFGSIMTTKTSALYEIIDRNNGDIVYSQEIISKGSVPFSYSFSSVARNRESVSVSVRQNILDFLNNLQKLAPNFQTKKK